MNVSLTLGQCFCMQSKSVVIVGGRSLKTRRDICFFSQYAFFHFILSLRTRKKSIVQECRLHEPPLQGQVAVQRVL